MILFILRQMMINWMLNVLIPSSFGLSMMPEIILKILKKLSNQVN